MMEKSGFQEHLKLSHETYMFVCAFHAFKYQSLHLATLVFLFILTLSHVRLFVTPWTEAHQAPLSKGFTRQEYWSGLPFPSPILLHIVVCICQSQLTPLFPLTPGSHLLSTSVAL